jgi:hypothetical protein
VEELPVVLCVLFPLPSPLRRLVLLRLLRLLLLLLLLHLLRLLLCLLLVVVLLLPLIIWEGLEDIVRECVGQSVLLWSASVLAIAFFCPLVQPYQSRLKCPLCAVRSKVQRAE